jgi:hypothetical protein
MDPEEEMIVARSHREKALSMLAIAQKQLVASQDRVTFWETRLAQAEAIMASARAKVRNSVSLELADK